MPDGRLNDALHTCPCGVCAEGDHGACKFEAVVRKIHEQGIACDYQCGWKFAQDGTRSWDCGCGNAELAEAVKAVLG